MIQKRQLRQAPDKSPNSWCVAVKISAQLYDSLSDALMYIDVIGNRSYVQVF